MRLNKLIIAVATFALVSCGEETTTDGNVAEVKSNDPTTEITNTPAEGSVSVTGNIQGATVPMIYLYKYGVNPAQTLDSSSIDGSGNFSFSFDQEGYGFVGVGFEPNAAALLLVGAGDELNLSGTYADWIRDYQISGTGYAKEVRAYLLIKQEFTDKIKALKTELASIPSSDVAAQQKINEQGMAIQDEFVVKRNQFIKDMDDTPALYIAIQDLYDPVADIEHLKAIAKATNKYMPNSMFADQVNNVLAQAEQQVAFAEQQSTAQGAVAIGKPAPELSFPTPEGKMLSLSSLKGKVVLLDFWASWCKPCRMENPNVVKLYNEYKDKGFTVFSVSLDNNKSKWVNAIEADGLIWPNHVSDLGGWNAMPAAIYSVNSIPQTYLIDADGTIIAKDLRGIDLANKLKEILG